MACDTVKEDVKKRIIQEAAAELRAGTLRAVRDVFTGALKLENADGTEAEARDMMDACIITGAATLALYDEPLRAALEGTAGADVAAIIHAHGHAH